MSLPLWSNLQKSQDDPETIEEAIARIVGEHNDEPTAHLGGSRSLQAHKEELTIDHPAGSILGDKRSNREIIRNLNCTLGEGWFYYDAGQFDDAPGFYVDSGISAPDACPVWLPIGVPGRAFLPQNYLTTFQCTVWRVDTGNNGTLRFGISGDDPTDTTGIYFNWVDGTLKGVARRTGETYESSAITHDLEETSVYRILIEPEDEIIYFFIDEVQVATLDIPAFTVNELNYILCFSKEGGGGQDVTAYFLDAFYSTALKNNI